MAHNAMTIALFDEINMMLLYKPARMEWRSFNFDSWVKIDFKHQIGDAKLQNVTNWTIKVWTEVVATVRRTAWKCFDINSKILVNAGVENLRTN
jgi:hypothetical protein